ncbi:MAG TPA: divalent-cation tolerance protein CutA [Candidatus Dormibacteraeota bacterium]|jgi:periplasmic divalent cation tolerance protein|nr:divalent-cation tolerance protein CutA [Candidatus Dormibacteraeota bacterium]
MAMAEKAVLILVTAGGRDDAERIGEGLIVEHLAASCNVIPTVASFYYWDGQLQRDHEALLLIKTLESLAPKVDEYVRTHHAYEHPEILQVPIEGGSSAYLNWLGGQVAKPSR